MPDVSNSRFNPDTLSARQRSSEVEPGAEAGMVWRGLLRGQQGGRSARGSWVQRGLTLIRPPVVKAQTSPVGGGGVAPVVKWGARANPANVEADLISYAASDAGLHQTLIEACEAPAARACKQACSRRRST